MRGRQGKRARVAERTDGYAAKLNAADRQQAADLKIAANAAQAESLGLEEQILGDGLEEQTKIENPSLESDNVTEQERSSEDVDETDTEKTN